MFFCGMWYHVIISVSVYAGKLLHVFACENVTHLIGPHSYVSVLCHTIVAKYNKYKKYSIVQCSVL